MSNLPEGYRVVETDQQVEVLFPRNLFPWTAKRRKRAIEALRFPASYRLVVEKHGFLDYRVVPYQNVLRKEDDEWGSNHAR